MNLTQIAQICSIIGVTVALVKLGVEVKSNNNNKHRKHVQKHLENTEIIKLKNSLKEQHHTIEHLEVRVSKLEERI